MGSTSEDRGRRLAQDADGNLLIAGYFSATVDFDPGPGSFPVTEAGSRDGYILKLDAAGNFIWVRTISGLLSNFINDMALDADGNIYVTGTYQSESDFDPSAGTYTVSHVGQLDAFIAKYDPDGQLLWAHGLGSSDYDNGMALAVHPDGDVVLCGYFNGSIDFDPGPGILTLTSAGVNDAFVCRLTSGGDLVWAKSIGAAGNQIAQGIVFDHSGHVVCTGLFGGTVDFNPGTGTASLTAAGSEDIFVLKLDGDGNFMWADRFGSTGGDWGNDIGVDSLNNVYSTGYFVGTVDFNPGTATGQVFNLTSAGSKDGYISVLDSNGVFVSARSFGGSADDLGQGLQSNADGSVLVTGAFTGTSDLDPNATVFEVVGTTSGLTEIFALRLDATGALDYAFGMGGTATDYGIDALEDTDGHLYMTGYFSNTVDFDPGAAQALRTSAGNLDLFIARYSPGMAVGTQQVNAQHSRLTIYPNPFANEAVIVLPYEADGSIEVRDLSGRTVHRADVHGRRTVIERGNLQAGAYLVLFTDAVGNRITERVMVY
jgi:hypothetical protein